MKCFRNQIVCVLLTVIIFSVVVNGIKNEPQRTPPPQIITTTSTTTTSTNVPSSSTVLTKSKKKPNTRDYQTINFPLIQFTALNNPICDLPDDSGPCRGKEQRYFFNSQLGRCDDFDYGGCGGNDNNFVTRQQCENECS